MAPMELRQGAGVSAPRLLPRKAVFNLLPDLGIGSGEW